MTSSLEEDLRLGLISDIFDAVEFEEGVSVHPLEHLEGRKGLAVVETSSAANEVICWGAHHRGLHSHSLLVVAGGVLHVGPDPQRALVVGTKIVASHILLTELVVVCLSSLAESGVSPLDRGVVDLSASVANFISIVEISELGTSSLLDGLSRAELGLNLRG